MKNRSVISWIKTNIVIIAVIMMIMVMIAPPLIIWYVLFYNNTEEYYYTDNTDDYLQFEHEEAKMLFDKWFSEFFPNRQEGLCIDVYEYTYDDSPFIKPCIRIKTKIRFIDPKTYQKEIVRLEENYGTAETLGNGRYIIDEDSKRFIQLKLDDSIYDGLMYDIKYAKIEDSKLSIWYYALYISDNFFHREDLYQNEDLPDVVGNMLLEPSGTVLFDPLFSRAILSLAGQG